MKRLLFATAAIALMGASTASACLVDGDGEPIRDGDGDFIEAGSSPCEIVLDASVLFAQGSAVLSAQGRAVLDGVDASKIDTVTGYASIEGSEASNLALSRARAQAVADYLGISPTIVAGGETTQFGDDLPSNRVVVLS